MFIGAPRNSLAAKSRPGGSSRPETVPELFIDGKPLAVAAPSPPSLEELLAAVEPLLAGSGRVLAEVRVDGSAWLEGGDPASWLAAGRIDLVSLSIDEAVARVAAEHAARLSALLPEVDAVACNVLRKAWDEAMGESVTVATRLGELMRDVESLMSSAPVTAEPAAQVTMALHAWIEAMEARDAAAVCLALDRRVLPALSALGDALKTVGRPP
jgi:hypothetical protein